MRIHHHVDMISLASQILQLWLTMRNQIVKKSLMMFCFSADKHWNYSSQNHTFIEDISLLNHFRNSLLFSVRVSVEMQILLHLGSNLSLLQYYSHCFDFHRLFGCFSSYGGFFSPHPSFSLSFSLLSSSPLLLIVIVLLKAHLSRSVLLASFLFFLHHSAHCFSQLCIKHSILMGLEAT